MTTPTPVTVVSVTGWCRNGSTILGNVLGEVPGFVHIGELHFLWKNAIGLGVNDLCGCGATLTTCPIWSGVLAAGVGDGHGLREHAQSVIARQRALVRTRHTRRVLRRGLDSADIRAHATLMGEVYQAIAARTGARVIVDTSKMAGESALLTHLPAVTPYFLHLVRDPRAAAHSWYSPKQYIYAMSPARSSAYWTGFNVAAHALTRRHPERSMFLRYEDFVADPAGTVDALLRWCGADPGGNPVHGRTVELHTNHTVTGNPDRFRTGATVIRDRDDAWRDALPTPARLAATALSWPLAYRYGYLGRRGAAAPATTVGAADPDPTGPGAGPRR